MHRFIIESLPTCVCYVDAAQRYRFANRRYRELVRAQGEICGKTLREVIGLGYSQIAKEVGAVLSGEHVQYRAFVQLPGAGERCFSATYVPDHDTEGKVCGFVAMIDDITDQCGVEDETRRRDARLESRVTTSSAEVRRYLGAFENMRLGLCILELRVPDDPRSLRFVSFNRGAELQTGYRRDEILGERLMSVFPRLAETRVPQLFAELALGGNPVTLPPFFHEHHPRIPDGWWAIQAFSVPDHCVGVAFESVTQRRELEVALRHAQKMGAIGLHTSQAAHEFNNLLMGVHGCAVIAASELEPDSAALPYVEDIRRSVESGALAARRLLDLAGADDAETELIDLNAQIRAAPAMLQQLVGDDVTLSVTAEASDPWVQFGAGQIEQLLTNLLINARDAMPHGGSVRLRTRDEPVREPGQERAGANVPHVLLDVIDTGSGMDAKTRAQIFDPFFTTKTPGKGTGLGLPLVYTITRQAGGEVEVRSRANEGTTFTLRLPRAQAPQPTAQPRAESRPSGERRAMVLLVEDDRLVRMTARHYLEEAGYQVLEAIDGADALDIAREHSAQIELLLSDVALPGLTGPDCAQEILRFIPGLSVVFMSAHSPEWLVREGHLAGDVRALQKPFTREALLAEVRNALHEKEALEPSAVSGNAGP
jgi:signal transduction histidine kinase/CheY-like chemotaxis protein